MFASPERRLLFDLNDFDETLPGPFEYDVKRMAASFAIAGRNNGFAKADIAAATRAAVTAYREAMAEFGLRTMDVWYVHLDEDTLMNAVRGVVAETATQAKAAKKAPKQARIEAKKQQKLVVHGQRMMQAASDIYLGWTNGADRSRHFYWRQLRDMKGSVAVETMMPLALTFYARTCGWTLARAHARSGDPVAIAEYLG